MCKLSDKLKLCSCEVNDLDSLKYFWILRRPFNEGTLMVGEMLPPPDIGAEATRHNINTLKKLLNDGSCFDANISPVEADELDLFFAYTTGATYDSGFLVYSFCKLPRF